MRVDVLIAGGGIAGLLLARALRQRGRTVFVADDAAASPAASRAAVGLLNPVIGPRLTLAWEAATALPVARSAYSEIGHEDAAPLLLDRPIVRVLRNDAERAAWRARRASILATGLVVTDATALPPGFRAARPDALAIHGAGVVDAGGTLAALQRPLQHAGCWHEQRCCVTELVIQSDHVAWPSARIDAGALVLAGGAADARPDGNLTQLAAHGLGWNRLLQPVKGESLIVHAPALAPAAVFICGHYLAPRPDGTWICGATHEPGVDDTVPTANARAKLEAFLHAHVTVPWTIVEHRAGVRSVTPDLRPVVGACTPGAPVYVFNGLGSRGFFLGPWLADRLAAHLSDGAGLPESLAPARFRAQ